MGYGLSVLVSPVVSSVRPPQGLTFDFGRGSTSKCSFIEFESYKHVLSVATLGLGMKAFSAALVLPFGYARPFSSFGTALPSGPPHLGSPSDIVFSCLWLLCSESTVGPFGMVRKC